MSASMLGLTMLGPQKYCRWDGLCGGAVEVPEPYVWKKDLLFVWPEAYIITAHAAAQSIYFRAS